MKISRSWIFKTCLIAGLFLTTPFSFATEPTQVPIPPDGTSDDPPSQPHLMGMTVEPSASATINDTELAIYFEWSVANATVTVYDELNQVVYQQMVNTDEQRELYIPLETWSYGSYVITVIYGNTTQRGHFEIY